MNDEFHDAAERAVHDWQRGGRQATIRERDSLGERLGIDKLRASPERKSGTTMRLKLLVPTQDCR